MTVALSDRILTSPPRRLSCSGWHLQRATLHHLCHGFMDVPIVNVHRKYTGLLGDADENKHPFGRNATLVSCT